jgi:hypothetical protein
MAPQDPIPSLLGPSTAHNDVPRRTAEPPNGEDAKVSLGLGA